MRAAWLAASLLACGDDGAGGGSAAAAAYVLPADVRLLLAPTDDPAGEATWLGADGEAWERRAGESWDDGVVLERLPVTVDDGLRVDDALLLPPQLALGETTDGVTVEALGSAEVWYGTFEVTVTVSIAEGRLAGEHILAEGFGPVRFTLDGASLDLVSYERLSLEASR